MKSLILTTATNLIAPLMLLFSFFLLLRGHNEPGGGFSGGLVGASAVALFAMTWSPVEARRMLRIDPHLLLGLGLLFAMGSGLFSLAIGQPFLTGLWHDAGVGTPLLFDTGVYLTVVGFACLILLHLAEEE